MCARLPGHRPVPRPPAASARALRSTAQQRCRAATGAPGTAQSRGGSEERAAVKREAVEAAQALVAREHPELAGLARDGHLLFVPRPEDYVERRADGYQEPERVLVVCVSHASPESAAAVTKVIQALRPDNVVVELCRSRAGVMYRNGASEASGSRDAARLRAAGMRRLVQEALDGSRSLPGLLLTLLSGRMQARVGRQLGADIGGEMRAARVAAEAVGAQLVLGDRPIEITLERAWAALPWGRCSALLGGLLLAPLAPPPPPGQAQPPPLPTGDAVDGVMDSFAAAYPEAAAALLDERELYLAWSLKRSKAVGGCRTVVGVVGAAHAAGVAWHLRTPSRLRFRDLVGPRGGRQPAAGRLPRWVGVLAGNLALAAGLQAAWELVTRQ